LALVQVFDIVASVGSTKASRELMRLHTDYTAAVARLAAAMRAFHAAAVPLDPGPRGKASQPWTAEHVRAVVAARDAWQQLVETRRAYDQSRRQLTEAR
jgi:hypothetical protein